MKEELETSDPEIIRDLIARCTRGDRVAQYRLYKQYSRPMYNLCLRMVSDSSVAEDLLQEAFVKIFRELHSFRGQGTLGAWLKRIVINQCLNHIRKKIPDFVPVDSALIKEIPEEEMSFNDISVEEIHNAILDLPEGARWVCVLHLLEGYRHSDVAAFLGISESTSKSQYRRAISLLQITLTKRLYEKQD